MASNSTQMGTPSANIINNIWVNVLTWLLLVGEVISAPCYLFMFYHLFGRKATRKRLHNHAILILLSSNFILLMIDVSLLVDYLRLGYKSLFTPAICFLHAYVDFGIWFGANIVMLWISIERHILIFHSNLLATARGRFLFHYVPLAVFSLYAPILYFYLVVLCPCQRVYTPLNELCGVICYYSIVPVWFIWFESIAHYIIPILLIAVFNVGLLVRVIVHKRRLQQTARWRRNRKMIIQLTLISTVYLIFDLPYLSNLIMQLSGSPSFASNIAPMYIFSLTFAPTIIVPYALFITLPKRNQKLRALLFWKTTQRTAVFPLNEVT